MNRILTTSFHGTEMYAFQLAGVVFVALRPVVEGMGLDWSAQLKRVKRDPILSEGVAMMAIPFGRGGLQDQVCLRLDLVHGWLFTIDSTRVHISLRERVQLYQRECYEVLFKHFSGDSEKLYHQQHESESLRLRKIDEIRLIFGNRAAAQAWKELGLLWVPAMDEMLTQPTLFDWADSQAA
jgi:P22_AR N-terminal domain